MAVMIPDTPMNFAKASREGEMFYALKERLSDDYYVFHSFKIVTTENHQINESETDFVIFSPDRGIICLEAKSGRVYVNNRRWYYASGVLIDHDGPYNQASNEKWDLIDLFRKNGRSDIVSNCKFLHAVWFPSYSKEDLKGVAFPSEADINLTLTSEDLVDPQSDIVKIFNMKVGDKNVRTNLNAEQRKYILSQVLCPGFNVIPSMKSSIDIDNAVFNRLLDEQANILHYMEQQKDAVINGVAGSGKTMIAVEKARMCADDGDNVLVLCFNRFLRDFLEKNKPYENVDYYTIDGFVCHISNSNDADLSTYNKAVDQIIKDYTEGVFKYKDIIIDEAQDFGQDRIMSSKIIETLKDIVRDETIDGCFYVFYDKLQFVQGKEIPGYINDADCRMTLYKNCRNTRNIATTSLRPFKDIRKPKYGDMVVEGETAEYYYAADEETTLNRIGICIEDCNKKGITDVVILTCAGSMTESIISSLVRNDKIHIGTKYYLCTTCRKFKGLEADAVILIDLSFGILNSDDSNVFYVGTSRARNMLYIISRLEDDQANELLQAYDKKPNKKNAKKAFATFLNARFEQL